MKQEVVHPPLMLTPIKAGFPNPAEDSVQMALDLNELIIRHPASTYFLRVEGDSMTGAGIKTGDIVVVDKSLEARSGDVVVATVDGDFTLKRLKKDGRGAWLMAEHPDYPPIALHEASETEIWGAVTAIIHQLRK